MRTFHRSVSECVSGTFQDKLMTNDGAGKRHEGADRVPDARDRGEERSVQAICLRYRLLNRQGAGATGEDRQFDDADGCSLWRSFSPRVISNSHRVFLHPDGGRQRGD